MENLDFDVNIFSNDIHIPQSETDVQQTDVNIDIDEDHDVFNFDNGSSEMEPEVESEEEPTAVGEGEGDTVIEEEGETSRGNYETLEHRKRNQMLTNTQKKMVYNLLLEKSVNGKLKRMHTNEVSNLLKLSLRTVQRIWKQHKDTPAGRQVDMSHKKTKNRGRKKIEIDLNQVQQLSYNKRTTLRSMGAALGVQHSNVFRLVEGVIRRHTNALKPYMKDENKRMRLQFCMSMIDWNNFPRETKFVAMYNFVHIDEKWFYMTKKSESYYLLPSEEELVRTCQSKNYIGKVMFLVAMGRPRFDNNGTELFSEKIGVFPFINMVPAQRRSRNRDAGTIEMKPITSVTRDVVRACLIDKVIPAIRSVWPQENRDEVIYIQQDNARTHVNPSDEQFQMAVSRSGLNLKLICQPPNSLYMNILDLGFFNAIQSLQHKESPRTVEELVQAVVQSFNEYPSEKVNHVWLSLQLCMQETMKSGGSVTYKIPHINKLQLERNGQLPTQISCDPQVLQNVQNILGV